MLTTQGITNLDLTANYDLGSGWGFNGHAGHLATSNITNGSYTDWKLGVTKDLSGWVLGCPVPGGQAKGNYAANCPTVGDGGSLVDEVLRCAVADDCSRNSRKASKMAVFYEKRA